ncbi:MAG: molybdopterin dinucleotide binding domain-containing protein, partial [Alphaproteobacteria bacterium]
ATNPLVSLPRAGALKDLPADLFVAVADCVSDTPTAEIADVLLPAAAWGEKDGTVTNSERRVSRQRAFLPLPDEAKPDWWILKELGKRLGHAAAFAYEMPAAIFREHAALAHTVGLDLDFGDPAQLDDDAYAALAPTAWPFRSDKRMFEDGHFFTEDGRARFIPIDPAGPAREPSPYFPFVLNTGRYRDHWHTLTRTGLSPTLSRHRAEPFVELHPDDAASFGLKNGDFARLESAHGIAVLKVRLDDGQQPGTLFVPMHWNGGHNRGAAINRLVAPITDPISGQPESKSCPVSLAPVAFRHRGFALARSGAVLADLDYCSRTLVEGGWLYEIATDLEVADWRHWFEKRLRSGAEGLSWSGYGDPARGDHRFAAVRGGRLEAALFIGADLPREWLASRLADLQLHPRDRACLLAGSAPGADPGPLVCACHGVGRNVIARAIGEDGLATTDAIGTALKAGTNCGSCLPELRALLVAAAAKDAIGETHDLPVAEAREKVDA